MKLNEELLLSKVFFILYEHTLLLFQSIFSPSLPSPNFIKRHAVDQLAWEYYFFPQLINNPAKEKKGYTKRL